MLWCRWADCEWVKILWMIEWIMCGGVDKLFEKRNKWARMSEPVRESVAPRSFVKIVVRRRLELGNVRGQYGCEKSKGKISVG